MSTNPQFVCPICRSKLEKIEKSFTCKNRHCFDIAKEGYVNLLPVQQKKSKQPGDNKIMIQSRRDFLNNHFYDMLIEPCARIINKLIDERFEKCSLLDIGCGDGYFTSKIVENLEKPIACYGMDISKDAVKYSAKTSKDIAWFVSSNNDLPLADNSIDIILKINSPINYEKSQYKLSENGIIVSVTPGEAHLNGLKKVIYDDPQAHEKESCPENYSALLSESVTGTMLLTNEIDIKNVFMMTPFFWNASQSSKEKINDLHSLASDTAFNINVWEKQ